MKQRGNAHPQFPYVVWRCRVDYQAILFDHNPYSLCVFGRSIGRVEPGYRADLSIYDYHPRTEVHSIMSLDMFSLDWANHVMSWWRRNACAKSASSRKRRTGSKAGSAEQPENSGRCNDARDLLTENPVIHLIEMIYGRTDTLSLCSPD